MPRGCQGASCETEFELYPSAITGLPLIDRFVRAEVRVTPRFVVAINAVTQAANGQEDYRFLPTEKGLELEFTDFASWFSGVVGPAEAIRYEGEVRLNPEWGRSVTRFVPVDPDQAGFFPAFQRLELFFQFRMTLPGLLGKRELHIFNRDAMRFVTEVPLDGFPPMDDPAFVSEGSVEMFDVAQPDHAPVGRFGKGRIIPIANVTYNIQAQQGDDPNAVRIGVSRSDGAGDVMTAILLRPYLGWEVRGETEARAGVSQDPLWLSARVEPASDAGGGSPGVFVRVASIDTEHLGFGRADIEMGDVVRTHAASIYPGGSTVELDAALFGIESGPDTHHIWIHPHGFQLTESGSTAKCVLPQVDQEKEVWFTHFALENGEQLGPNISMVRITPS